MNETPLRKPHNIAAGSLITIISYFCVALMGVLVKLMPHTVNIALIIFFQYVIGLLICLPGVYKQGISSLKTQRFAGHLLRDFAGIITFGLFFLSLNSITLLKSIVLRSTTPFWIPLILFIWRRDVISRGLWLSIIVGFIGVVCIVKPGTQGYFSWGTFYALGSGLVMAISALTIRRISSTEPAQRTLFYYFLIASLVSLPFALYHWSALSGYAWLLLLAIGILMFIIQYTLIIAFQYAKASVLAPMSYSAIIFSGLFDLILWHQYPDAWEYLGIALIVITGISAILLERKKEAH